MLNPGFSHGKIEISVKYQVMSDLTSFLGICKNDQKPTEVLEKVEIWKKPSDDYYDECCNEDMIMCSAANLSCPMSVPEYFGAVHPNQVDGCNEEFYGGLSHDICCLLD